MLINFWRIKMSVNYKCLISVLAFSSAILSGSLFAQELTLENLTAVKQIDPLPAPAPSTNNICGPEVREQVIEALREVSTVPEGE